MKHFCKVLGTMFVMMLAAQAQGQLVWVGGVSTDMFDVANWDLSATAVTTLAPNVSVSDNVLIGPGPFANNPIIPELDAQQRFQLDDGYSFTLDGATLGVAGNDGVGGATDTTNGPTVNVINGAQFNSFFVVNDVKVKIDGTSTATFGGGGNPINLSTVDIAPGGTLAFINEDPAAFRAEHLSKTFVLGSPGVEGVNLNIISDGAVGSIITVVPEPSSITLAFAAGAALLSCRRRRVM
ncbi:MAG: hypothetical protein KDA92_00855 [Planctomycetales bacterium]|nr:hypothetical protein [Planctomycetales bacterium]